MAKFQSVEYSSNGSPHPDTLIQTYEHISKLNYGMAIFYEALRMYPIVGS